MLRYYKPADLGKTRFDIIARVNKILDEGSYTNGNHVNELARELETKTGYAHAILFGAGTHAIFVLARWYKSLGYKRILCPAFTWPSTYLPFEWCGFQVEFVDIDPETWLADFGEVPSRMNELRIPVDTFGNVYPHNDDIWPRDRKGGFGAIPFIDSAQSLGAKWDSTVPNRIVSLSGSKIVTSGEGGALLTQSDELAKFAESIRGWFSRMPETSAVIGLAYLSQLSTIVEKKREIAFKYEKTFGNLGNGSVQFQKIPVASNHYIVAGLVDAPMNFILANSGIEFRRYYETAVNESNERIPMANLDGLPNTKNVSRRILAFPSAPDMDLDAIDRIVEP